MEYGCYHELVVLYLVYSLLGWVGETVAAAARGPGFVKRGLAAGPWALQSAEKSAAGGSAPAVVMGAPRPGYPAKRLP